ncbi:MAG: hypothetical protein R2751_19970 [Bacteroidales bacterium]
MNFIRHTPTGTKLGRWALPVVLLVLWTGELAAQVSFRTGRERDRALDESIALIRQMEYELAAVRLNECLELDSSFAPAYLQRGRIFLEWGAVKDALADLDRAIALDPGLGEACFYKGYALYGRDTTGMDALLFDRAISNGYTSAWAYYYRGLTRIRDGKDDLAIRDFSEAIDLRNDFPLAYHERAGVKRRLGDLQGALYDYRTAIGYRPDFPQAFHNMGSVRILLGDYQGALSDFSTALDLDSTYVLAWNNRGYARYYTGDLEGRRKISPGPSNPDFPITRQA